MAQREWIFLSNPFETATRGSYKLARTISLFHYNALTTKAPTEPLAAARMALYAPLHTAYLAAYAAWGSQGDTQEGQTLTLTQLLALLSGSKINDWDIAIQGVYNKNSPEYKALLPHRRTPFQSGTQEGRLVALGNLLEKVIADHALSAIAPAMHIFKDQVYAAFAAQKQSLIDTSTDSSAVEAARIAMCTGQLSDYGAFMDKFAATPLVVGEYFDLRNIRQREQVKFSGSQLAAGASQLVVQHTFANGDELRLRNTGAAGALQFSLQPTATYSTPATPYSVAPGADLTLPASDLGDLANAYLFIHNPGTAATGWKLDIL